MRYIDYDPTTGQVYRDYDYSPPAPIGSVLQIAVTPANVFSCYVENGLLVEMPPYPNEYSVFDYTTKQWVDTRTNDTQWAVVRADRNQRLQATDWTQLADIPAQTKSLWEPYRQELRDVTSQSDPFNIVWPTPPQ